MENHHCLLVEGALMDQPQGLFYEVGRLRAFAHAKDLLDRAKDQSQAPPWAIKLLTPVLERIYGVSGGGGGDPKKPEGAFGTAVPVEEAQPVLNG